MACGPPPGIATPCSKHTGKIAGIYLLLPLNDLANLKATGLSQTAYDFTLVCHFVDFVFACSLSPGLLSSWRPRVLSKPLGSLQLLPSARRNLRRCFPYFSSYALGLSWLSWGPRVLSKHLGTLYNCFPGLLRSSPLVFLQLASSLEVSPGSAGVSGCLVSAWRLSTIASRACRDLRSWFFYDSLPRLRSLLALLGSPGAYSAPGGLTTIASQACRDLRRWFFYDSLPRSRSLLALLGSPGA